MRRLLRIRSDVAAGIPSWQRGDPCGLGAALAHDGYRVVAWTTDTSPTPRTLRTLVTHERTLGARQVVLVGASAGGATSIVGAGPIDPPVDALVARSPAGYALTQGADVDRAVRRYSGRGAPGRSTSPTAAGHSTTGPARRSGRPLRG